MKRLHWLLIALVLSIALLTYTATHFDMSCHFDGSNHVESV